MTIAYIALGSNLGERQANLQRAVATLCGHPEIALLKQARIIETAPLGPSGQEPYLNTVLEIETSLTARQLLATCLDVEDYLGRERKGKWAARTIDLDLILFGNEIIDEPGLSVPHMEMCNRRFVLEPLCEIAPDFIHPVLNMRVYQLLERLRVMEVEADGS